MVDPARLRAWWSHRQGLGGDRKRARPAEVLEASGWARSVAGVGPYFTLFARAGISRATTDSAVAVRTIHELPAARGCTYVVPAADFALALKVGQPFREAEMRVARSLGVTDAELDRLCEAVRQAVSEPRTPDEIRDAVGKAARNLGEAGKKKGLTTTLPLALGRLQAEGAIRRIPENGRLDQQRYRYTYWSDNPLATFRLTQEEACTELARRYFRWIGPARMVEWQWFSGLGVKAAAAATEPLALHRVADEWRLLPEDAGAFEAFRPAHEPEYVLVSGLDAIAALRRDGASLVAEQDRDHPLFRRKGGAAMFADLPHHAILDRGRLVGFWEYDTETKAIVWAATVASSRALKQAVALAEEFVREDLGDARSFSLDSPKSRKPAIAALRAAAG